MDTKKVSISGTNNKYQMKKLLQPIRQEKPRLVTQNWIDDYFLFSNQLELLPQLLNSIINKHENQKFIHIFINEIERKISCYKQQDINKKIFNPELFISLNLIIKKLIECEMKCLYCKSEMLVIYKNVREPKQWTLDRVNNDLGHNKDNIVLSCLECNLKRRNKNKDSFLFTKQLKIVREKIDNNEN